MKARTSGSGRTGCEAVQYSDEMQCARCGLAYDANDPDPPECTPVREVHIRKGCTPGPTTYLDVDGRLSWPDDEGRYLNNCIACGGLFQGDKHRRNCRQCAPRNPVVVSSGRAILDALKRDLQK